MLGVSGSNLLPGALDIYIDSLEDNLFKKSKYKFKIHNICKLELLSS